MKKDKQSLLIKDLNKLLSALFELETSDFKHILHDNKKLKKFLSCFLAAPKIQNLKILNRISESSVINLTRVGRAGPCKGWSF